MSHAVFEQVAPIGLDPRMPQFASTFGKPRVIVVMDWDPDYDPPTINAVNGLQRHFEVHLLCLNIRLSARPRLTWPTDVRIERIGKFRENGFGSPLGRLIAYLRLGLALRAAIARLRPVALYAVDPSSFSLAVWARGKTSLPIVFKCNDFPDYEAVPQRSLRRFTWKYALHHTKDAALTVFAGRERAEYWLGKAGDRRSAAIVPHVPPLSFALLASDLNETIFARWRDRKLIYMGGVGDDIIAYREMLTALARLDKRYRMDWIGWWEPAALAKSKAHVRDLGLEQRVLWTGTVPHSELAARALHGSLGTVLSKPLGRNALTHASASVKLFEYAALAIPVLVPDLESFRNFFRNEEWVSYANLEDPESIARAVECVFDNEANYFRRSLAARAAFQKRFNHEVMFQPVLERLFAAIRYEAGNA